MFKCPGPGWIGTEVCVLAVYLFEKKFYLKKRYWKTSGLILAEILASS